MELRSLLQRVFKEENINIKIRDSDSLNISFINSSFNNLPSQEIGIKAWQVAKFARDNYRPQRFSNVWVSFLESKTYLGVFESTRSLGTYKFEADELADALRLPPPAYSASVTRSFYDPGRGVTDVYVENLMQLYGTPQNGLALSPHFSVPGKTIRAPEKVVLDFRHSSTEETFLNKPKLTIAVDGRVIFSGDMEVKQSGREPDGTFSENLTGEIPYRQYSQLIAGKQVKMTLGPKDFELTSEHLAALRELNKCVVNSSCE